MRLDAFYWSFPAGVALSYHDGRTELRVFPTRLAAEQWLSWVPWGQLLGVEEFGGIATAIVVLMLGG